MKLKLRSNSKGFTIIEVMIVVAVTGAMFLSIVGVINGKQKATQFQTSVNDLRTQMQQVANEVSTGYFPSSDNYFCQPTATSIIIRPLPDTTGGGQCVYIGKAIHFYDDTTDTSDKAAVYTIIAKRDVVDDYKLIYPHVVAPLPGYEDFNAGNDFDATTNVSLQYGLTARWLKYTDSSGNPVTAGASFAFMQSLNASGSAASGGSSQHLRLVAFSGSGSTFGNTQAEEASVINNSFKSGSIVLDSTVNVCFDSGTTNQSVVLTIDTAASRVGATTKINSGLCS